ncbi:MAG: hypothetical protein COW03_06415 [Cytophagales bacterium CG12_big_fil_rev_8_21_14_0_65_40_12]|nr:MAG: hypothetical protein COW03_06415 [Cytophagales bacterium CG12_big_fil_rev_8_21_14_0_65_40_12]PIW03282.1 MAG: hypothetical protein COW40_15570 [Cytophagales bacterium CG17_big_fil_post_rev_8_21_14_2_50_40_13]
MKNLNKSIWICILILFSILVNPLYSQTGPGGVGNASSNILWLRANDITGLTNGDDVSTWTDANGISLTQPNSSFTPIYQTGVINGLPVVRFNKTNGRLRRGSYATFPTTNITAIYVNRTSDSGDGVISYASTGSDNDFLLFRSENLNVYRGSSNIGSSVSFNNNAFHIANASWRSSDGRVEVWKDGSQSFTSTGFRTGTSILSNGTLAIAGEQDSQDGGYADSQAHFGDFAEIIIFNTFLNTAQNIIVSNYLASKYNLTITNDRFAFDPTYRFDVAGIGRQDAGNTHTAAMSANILRIQNPSDLNADPEYLLFGHDNADATTAWTTTEAPNSGTNIQRLAREWRLDETGDVGTIDVVVNTAAMPTLPAGHTMYALMVDVDGDFSSGASVYEMVFSSGTEYTVTGLSFNDGDYMAIAALRPVIQHTITASSGSETVNSLIGVEINFIPSTSKTVQVNTADITATSGSDYTALVANVVTITAGNTTANYTVNITNDVSPESNETFSATLSSPSAGLNLGTNTVHTYTIIDNDISRKVYFDAASSSGSEATTSVNIGLSISEVDAVNPTTVDYTVTGGTATGTGTDFTLASGTVTFPATVTAGTINVTINNETLFENNETIIISLSNPTNSNLDNTMPFGGTGFIDHTYTINNDDTAPSIQFNSTSSSGSETVTSVNFQVDLSTVSGANASANYTVAGVTATGGGVDFTLASGTVTVLAGNSSANITATIINDTVEELSETFTITLSAPTNASIGTNTIHTYTIINNSVIGITGPGGVGQASSNILWVRPEELTIVADGTDITAWNDFSGNNRHLSQANTSLTPRYYNNIVNGRPVARFEQADNRMVRNSFTGFASNQISAFYVNRTTDSGEGLISYASLASDNDFLLFSSNSLQFFRGTSTTSGVSFNNNVFNIAGATWQSSDGATAVWRNGTQSYSTTFQTGTSITSGGTLAIGGEQDGVNSGYDAAQAHSGDFAEIAIYNLKLNSTQAIIVQNYLAAKYGLTLASNDVYFQDNALNGDFDYEVAGIGRIGSSDFHADAKGSGIVRINDPQDLDDEEFLMWGHNSASLNATNTGDVPAGVSARFERVWRVSEVNRSAGAVDVGEIDISFDLTGLGNVTITDLVLLVDADGVFGTGAIEVAGAIDDGGNVYRFNNVSAITNNVYFTLATRDSDQTPLPIELISFTARPIENSEVILNWSTVSETGNSHFNVERSNDGSNFETIAFLPGAGDSRTQLSYEYTDKKPGLGRSFYRLKQTDFSGEFEYSELVSVFVKSELEENNYTIFPNPISNNQFLNLQYQSNSQQMLYIKVLSLNGQIVEEQISAIEVGSGRIELDARKWPKGLNVLRIFNQNGQSKAFRVLVN